jgi:cytochrome c biogenesis protein CcmG, thiol:disulfide interchange protein DsbE
MKVILLFIAMLIGACHQQPAGLKIGDEIPHVTFTDLQGKTMTLPNDMKGKVVLLHFWNLDCHFCDKKNLLLLEPLYQKYKAQAFVPIAVNVGIVDKTDERWKQFTELSYPMLIDERGLIAKQFSVIGLPTTFVIDGAGIVQKKLTGEAPIDDYEKLFTSILTRR